LAMDAPVVKRLKTGHINGLRWLSGNGFRGNV
jgi:hypothetical protein